MANRSDVSGLRAQLEMRPGGDRSSGNLAPERGRTNCLRREISPTTPAGRVPREAATAIVVGQWLQTVLLWLQTRKAAALAVLLAGWPVLRWYVARLNDGSDEPFGLVALAAAALFLPRTGWGQPLSARRQFAVVSLLAGYAASYPWAPPLGHALLWLGAAAAVVAPRSYALAWSGLLLLALPLVATVQFYLGYPLRCVTTFLAAGILHCGGIPVSAHGTVLQWAGERVLIDVPCAGIQMLWTLLLVTAVLATAQKLSNAATLRLLRWASAAVFVANTVRAVALFCIEEHVLPTPPAGHEGVGLALFAAAAGVLVWRARWERAHPREFCTISFSHSEITAASTRVCASVARRFSFSGWFFLALTAIAAVIPWIHTSPQPLSQAKRPDSFPGWEAAPLPAGLTPVNLGPREQRFARDFPGRIGAFTDGTRTWVVRWLAVPTRKLHPTADCLRGSGYQVAPGFASPDREGNLWAGCRASRDGTVLRVTERIFGRDGEGWTDVSAWYWHAVLERDPGPWWAVTLLQPAG